MTSGLGSNWAEESTGGEPISARLPDEEEDSAWRGDKVESSPSSEEEEGSSDWLVEEESSEAEVLPHDSSS